jgi:uncharacterized protein YneF (UPF0154 family)
MATLARALLGIVICFLISFFLGISFAFKDVTKQLEEIKWSAAKSDPQAFSS